VALTELKSKKNEKGNKIDQNRCCGMKVVDDGRLNEELKGVMEDRMGVEKEVKKGLRKKQRTINLKPIIRN
jgi:predicted transcriptional regulator